MNKCPPLIVVVGPTASGKSALAMQMAKAYNGEIIAADSRTIYRGMDIGTAKPTREDQSQVPHHLLDVRDPDESFSAAEFKGRAVLAIEDISSRGKLPILVGGTGLYIDSVIFDYQFGPTANQQERDKLNAMTIEELQAICRHKNITIPINSKNKRHLVRAIELGGLIDHKKQLRAHTFVVGISTEKEILKERITLRTNQMIEAGVIEEVQRVGRAYNWSGEALKGNIYRIFRGVIEGTKTQQEAASEFIQSDLALAKRQMTWFRRNPFIVWSNDPQVLLTHVDTFLRQDSN